MVQVHLQLTLPPEDYNTVLRYATLEMYDPQAGVAVLHLPNVHLCRQVQGRLAAPITAALTQAAGTPITLDTPRKERQ